MMTFHLPPMMERAVVTGHWALVFCMR
jgi:hypothetical protein